MLKLFTLVNINFNVTYADLHIILKLILIDQDLYINPKLKYL